MTIKVREVKKSLGGREILKGVSFEVEKGDIFGFLGPNGAGKTTTIRTMLGLYSPDSGSVEILGQDVRSPGVRGRIGFALDPDGLYERMTAAENLAFYLKIHHCSVDRQHILETLDMFSLKDRADDKAGTFSKGMRQRLTIARALVHDPDVMILDEPTSGVDPMEQMKIRSILMDISERKKKTIFLSTHNMDEVQRICNRIAILHQGTVQLTGELAAMRRQMGEGSVTFMLSGAVPAALEEEWKTSEQFRLLSHSGNEYTFAGDPDRAALTERILKQGLDVLSVKRNDAGIEQLYTSIVSGAGQ